MSLGPLELQPRLGGARRGPSWAHPCLRPSRDLPQPPGPHLPRTPQLMRSNASRTPQTAAPRQARDAHPTESPPAADRPREGAHEAQEVGLEPFRWGILGPRGPGDPGDHVCLEWQRHQAARAGPTSPRWPRRLLAPWGGDRRRGGGLVSCSALSPPARLSAQFCCGKGPRGWNKYGESKDHRLAPRPQSKIHKEGLEPTR